MFGNKRYFYCPPDSGVFVGLDKLIPREVSDSKLVDTVVPSFLSFLKGKSELVPLHEGNFLVLEIGERVVTFVKDSPARGTVRYIGKDEDGSGNVRTIVGLELVGNALINKKI